MHIKIGQNHHSCLINKENIRCLDISLKVLLIDCTFLFQKEQFEKSIKGIMTKLKA